MAYNVNQPADQIVGKALAIASDGCLDINAVLVDISQPDNALTGGTGSVAEKYGATISGSLSINTAAGAMVIDDLMQKISTKVQVAAQLLSAANNMSKTASRILSQG
jgi:hypothetical protein